MRHTLTLAFLFLLAAGVLPAATRTPQPAPATLLLGVVAPLNAVTGHAPPAAPPAAVTYDVLSPLARFDGKSWHEYSPSAKDVPREWRVAGVMTPHVVRLDRPLQINGCVAPLGFAIQSAPAAWREPAEDRTWMAFAVSGAAQVSAASDVSRTSEVFRTIEQELSKRVTAAAEAAIDQFLRSSEVFLSRRAVPDRTPRLEAVQVVACG